MGNKSRYSFHYKLFSEIDSLLETKKIVNIAIDGNSGAGKSTLSHIIWDVYDCNIFHMDDFFLSSELRTEERLKEIGGNVDYIRFRKEIIKGLESGQEFKYRPYNCRTDSLNDFILVTPKKLNIIEGVYSMHPTLIDSYDFKVFLEIDPKEQSSRIYKRNGESMYKRYIDEWIPLENDYFKHMKIREKSDMILYIS